MSAGSEELERLLKVVSRTYEPLEEHRVARAAIRALFAERAGAFDCELAGLREKVAEREAQVAALRKVAAAADAYVSGFAVGTAPQELDALLVAVWNARNFDFATVAREHDARIVRNFVGRVNAIAEADMLAGNPITGAHHRALDAELAKLSEPGGGE